MAYELPIFISSSRVASGGNDILGSTHIFQHDPKDQVTLVLNSDGASIGNYGTDTGPQSVIEYTDMKTGYADDDLGAGTEVYLGFINEVRTHQSEYLDNDRYLLAYLVDQNGNALAWRLAYVLLPIGGSPPVAPGTTLYPTRRGDNNAVWEMPLSGEASTDAPCFTPGTMIATPTGAVAVETLRPGDAVLTRDHGVRFVRWRGEKLLTARALDLAPNLLPIRIEAGALGEAAPQSAITVSPQHRVLVSSRIARRLFGSDEALVAARHLLGLPGISVEHPQDGITYLHLGFDQHEILFSNGLWTESFFPGPQALRALTPAARHEFLTLFPAFRTTLPTGARRFLTGKEARKLTLCHERQGRALLESL